MLAQPQASEPWTITKEPPPAPLVEHEKTSFSRDELRHVEMLITWYLLVGHSDACGTGSGQSSLAGSLARAETYSLAGVMCAECGGSGVGFAKAKDALTGATRLFEVEGGCLVCHGAKCVDVLEVPKSEHGLWTVKGCKHCKARHGGSAGACKPCRGTGRRRKPLPPEIAVVLLDAGTDPKLCPSCSGSGVCEFCEGDGYTDEGVPTAFVGAHEVQGPAGYTMDEAVVGWSGAVRRVLEAVRVDSPLNYLVLELYCGYVGQLQGIQDRPRDRALYPITEGGKWLVKDGRKRDGTERLSDYAVIDEQIERDRETPNGDRGAAVMSAQTESARLVRVARQALWDADVSEGGRLRESAYVGEAVRLANEIPTPTMAKDKEAA